MFDNQTTYDKFYSPGVKVLICDIKEWQIKTRGCQLLTLATNAPSQRKEMVYFLYIYRLIILKLLVLK